MGEMEVYKVARRMLPAESEALLAVGWINWERAKLVYNPVRFREAANSVVSAGDLRVDARASLVSFQDGQLLMLTLVHGKDFHKIGELASLPPNGIASAAALQNAPNFIGKFMSELMQWELKTVSVMCCQGLVDHVEYIAEKLKTGSPGVFEPFVDVLVYPSTHTHASTSIGVPPTFDPITEMNVMMARLPQ